MPQNYFVTHCDVNYLVYAERLFASLKKHSKYRIIFFAIDFDYVSKFDNVDVIRCNSKKELDKNALTFIKSSICAECLNLGDYNYVYLDADCIALSNCDDIFKFVPELEDFPLTYRSSRDYLIKNGRGNPFIDENETIDWNKTLEAPLLKFLGLPVEIRGQYGQTGVVLFNGKSRNLINEWVNLCNNEQVLKNQDLLAPFLDEGVLNVLLWKYNKLKKLPQVLINIPYEVDGVAEPDIKIFNFVENIKNPKDKEYYTSTFCRIPSKADIGNLMFLHGKISEEQNRLLNKLMYKENPKKYLIFSPHFSSGGSVSWLNYLVQKILLDGNVVKVVEYCCYSLEYVTHRNQMIEMVGIDNFYSFGNIWDQEEIFFSKLPELKSFIDSFNPDVIFLNDPAEKFSMRGFKPDFCDWLYRKDRPYKIEECIHESTFPIEDKRYLPDEFVFCCDFYLDRAKSLNVPMRVVEMELPTKKKPNRAEALKLLGLREDYLHVLNVALWIPNKNQPYLLNIARQLVDRKIQFHFVGGLFMKNEMVKPEDIPSNVVIWGERKDVDNFYCACDLFALCSFQELNPISIIEALSWK